MDFSEGKLPTEILDKIWRLAHLHSIKKLNKEFEKYFTPWITFYDNIPKEKYTKPSWFKFWIEGASERKKILENLSYWREKRRLILTNKEISVVYNYTSEEYIIEEDELMDI